jgi:hypothetical protein
MAEGNGSGRAKTVAEAEWLSGQYVSQAMVSYLRCTRVTRTKAGKRKLRLFACACCRLTWGLLTDPLLRQAVEVAERFAEARTGKDELERANQNARGVGLGGTTPDVPDHQESTAAWMAGHVAEPRAFDAAFYMTAYPLPGGRCGDWDKKMDVIIRGLLRCIFGNPFRPASLNPAVLAWNDATVVRLAQAPYNERKMPEGTLDNGRMAVLADALEEAGCTDAEILGHLRGPGPHVRGCWVIDLLLGKS